MRPQTERLRLEYRDSVARARELVSSCSPAAFRSRASDGTWSAAQCIEHLNLTNAEYVRRMRDELKGATVRPPRREEKLSLVGRLVVRTYEPPVRRRFTAGGTLVPAAEAPRTDVIMGRFEQAHRQMIALLEETDVIDRTVLRIPLGDFDWLRLTLFDILCLLAAHDRRHLWQAERAARV